MVLTMLWYDRVLAFAPQTIHAGLICSAVSATVEKSTSPVKSRAECFIIVASLRGL